MTGNLSIWLTPVWILAAGVTLGAVVLMLLYGIVWLISRPAAATTLRVVRESVLQWISYVVLAYAVFFVIALPMVWGVRIGERNLPQLIVSSLSRLPYVGPNSETVDVPARTDDFEVPFTFQADELQQYTLRSEQDVIVNAEPGKAYSAPQILVEGGEPYVWAPGGKRQRIFEGMVEKLYVTNQSDAPTKLTIELETDIQLVEARQVPITAAAVVGVYARVPFDALAVAEHFDDRSRDIEGSRRSAAVFARAFDRRLSADALYRHPVQHVWRRREDVQGLGDDDDYGVGNRRRFMDGERFGRRRNRGPHRVDAAFQTSQPASVCAGQVFGNRLAKLSDVCCAGGLDADLGFVQGRI